MPDPLAHCARPIRPSEAGETPMQHPALTEPNGRPKHITVVTPCYNEVENVRELYEAIKQVFAGLPQYTYDHIYIDNASKDGTAGVLREIAAEDANVRVIINARNFGHIRSPYHALPPGGGGRGDRDGLRLPGPAGLDPGVPPEVGGGIQDRRRGQGRVGGEPG